MTEEFQLNDDTYTGTKEVSENLKFESKLLQEWINDNVKDSGNIEKIEQFKGGSQIQHIKFRLKIMLMF